MVAPGYKFSDRLFSAEGRSIVRLYDNLALQRSVRIPDVTIYYRTTDGFRFREFWVKMDYRYSSCSDQVEIKLKENQ